MSFNLYLSTFLSRMCNKCNQYCNDYVAHSVAKKRPTPTVPVPSGMRDFFSEKAKSGEMRYLVNSSDCLYGTYARRVVECHPKERITDFGLSIIYIAT